VPPSRPPPIDLDRFDAMRHRSNQRPDQSRQNGNGSNNGAARQPKTGGQAAPIPGAPLSQPLPGSRPTSRGGKKKDSDDDDGKGKGKGVPVSAFTCFAPAACFCCILTCNRFLKTQSAVWGACEARWAFEHVTGVGSPDVLFFFAHPASLSALTIQ